MKYAKKIVLNSTSGYRQELDALVEVFKKEGVKFIGVAGVEASRLEDIIDELCVGDGSTPYEMLTSSHPNETLEEVIEFAEMLGFELEGQVQVVTL